MIGDIFLFGADFAPRGYMYCQGQTLQINQYPALFSIIGTKYGGDGRTTFQLPNLKDKCLDSSSGDVPRYVICANSAN